MKNVAALGLGSSNQKPSNTYDDPKMSLSKLLFFYARIFHVQESSSGKVLVGLVDLLLRDELNQQNLKEQFNIVFCQQRDLMIKLTYSIMRVESQR